MNDEIKNILDEFMNFDFNSQWEKMEINEYESNILKDYITNLQQENERLNQDLIYYQRYGADMLHKNNILEERIEKAVEELELWQPGIKAIKLEKKYLLDILLGRSDE